jgi:hypothetical protein
MNTNKKIARMAGLFYLIFILLSILVKVLGQSSMIILGDAAATSQNITAPEELFRLSFMSDLLSALFFLLAAWALYDLLKPVNINLALLFLLLNLGGVTVQSLNLLNQFAAVLLLRGGDYLDVFPAGQVQAMALFFLSLHENGFMIAQIFYGAWLFPLGYLIYKSGFLPKVLGILVLTDCVCWLAYFFQYFLFPNFTVITYLSFPVGFLAEFGLALWLLMMGAKDQRSASVEIPRDISFIPLDTPLKQ